MVQKYEIVQALAQRFALTSYLEIATPTTGFTFGKVLRDNAFQRCHRLLYNCPETHDDQQPITFRTTSEISYELTQAVIAASDGAARYDIIFVDPFHTYRASVTDLCGAWALLQPGGFMVVHDCNPENSSLVSPNFVEGKWCGVTYQAYVDFILFGLAEHVVTIDSDYGVGVLRKAKAPHLRMPPRDQLLLDWTIARDRDDLRFQYFEANRAELLNLIPPEQFRSHFDIAEPEPLLADPVDAEPSPSGDCAPPKTKRPIRRGSKARTSAAARSATR